MHVQPRQTPAERAASRIDVQVDAWLADVAAQLEDWVEPRQPWSLLLREGHDFGRANNVEAVVAYASGETTASASFRLDQVSRIEEQAYELVLALEEEDGIAKLLRLSQTGLEVELFHILTVT
jgi:hypothetical protein